MNEIKLLGGFCILCLLSFWVVARACNAVSGQEREYFDRACRDRCVVAGSEMHSRNHFGCLCKNGSAF